MQMLIISGSRNPDGQTAQAAKALLSGLEAAGGEGEIAYLPTMTIERCRQCNEAGWGECKDKGTCVIDDDFAALVERIGEADAVVFANPVYFSDLSESLKTFLDRMRRICRHDNGKRGITDKPCLGICVAGGGGGGAPTACVCLEKVVRTCGFDLVDVVPVRRQNLDMKCDVLETTGRWLAGQVG